MPQLGSAAAEIAAAGTLALRLLVNMAFVQPETAVTGGVGRL